MTPVLTYLNAFPGIPYPQHLSGQTSTQSYMIPGAAIRTKTVTVLQSYNAFPGIPFPQHLSKADTNPYNTHKGITQSFILAGGVQPNTVTIVSSFSDAAVAHWGVGETPLGNREVYMVFNSTFKPTMAALPTKKTSKTVGTFVALATALIQKQVNKLIGTLSVLAKVPTSLEMKSYNRPISFFITTATKIQKQVNKYMLGNPLATLLPGKQINVPLLFNPLTAAFLSSLKNKNILSIITDAVQLIKQSQKNLLAPVVVFSGINPAFNPVSNTTYIPASTVNANNFSTIASGSTIVVMAYTGSTGAATTGVSDGINTYLQANATAGTAGLYGVGLYYCLNATSVPIGTVFTATSSSGSAYTAGIQVLQANTRLDQSNSAVYIASPATIQVNATPLGIFEAAVGAFYSNSGVAGVTGGINNLHPFPGNLPNFFMTYQTDAGNLQTFAPTVNQFPYANGCAAIATFFMPDTSSQKQVNKYMLAGVTAAITSALRQANKYFLNAVTTTFGLLPAFVNVSSVNAYEGAANNTQAIPAGSTIVVMGYTGSNGAATTGVSDGINTYLQANASAATTNIPGAGLYYCTNALAVPINTVFTATASSGSGYVGPIQQLPPGSILDQTNNAINTGGVGASNPFNISSGTLLSSTEISIAAFATVQSADIQASGKSNNYITFGSSTFNECYISYNNIGSTAAIASGIASGIFPPNGGAALATFIMPIGAIKQVNKIVGVAKTTLQAFFAYLKSGYSQAVYAAVLAQAYLVKQTNKYMTGAINVIANIQKQVNKYMTGPINVIALIQKQVNKAVLIAKITITVPFSLAQKTYIRNFPMIVTTAAYIQKQTEKYILAVVTTGSKIQKQVNKYMTGPVIDVALLGQRAIKRTILFGVIMTNQTTKAITIGFRLTVVTVQAFAAAVKQSGGHLYSGLVTVLIGAGQGINGYPYLGFFFGEFSGGGVSIQKQTNKYMTGPVTVMALLGQRSIQRTIQFGVSAVDLISKQINKLALKSTVTMSAFIQKQTNKYMLGLVTTVTKIQKQTNKYMLGLVTTATLLGQRSLYLFRLCIVTTGTLIQKTVNIYRLFLVTTQSFASAVKSSGGHSYSTVATILIGAGQGIKQTNKYITAPVIDTALLGQRAINRTIQFGVSAVDLISKQINKAVLKAVVTVTAQTQHISQLVRTFPSTVTMAAKIQKTVDKNIQAGVNMIAQIFKKNLALFRLFPVTMSALSQKQINKAVLVVNVLVTVPFTLAQKTFIRGFISTVMMVAKLQQRSIGVYRLFQVIDAVQVTKQLTKTIGIFVMLTVAKIQKTVLKSSLLSGVTTSVFYTRSLSKSLLFVITTVATVVTEKFHAPQIFTGKITLAAVIQKTPLKNFISTVTVACKTGLRSLAKYILLVVQVTETTQKFLTRTAIKVGVSLIGLVVPKKVTIRTYPSTVTMAAKTGVRAIGKIVNAFVTMKALNYLQNITKTFILFGVNASAIALKQINKQPFIAKITNKAFVNVRKPINKLATVTITAPYKIYQVLKNVMAFVSAAANRGNRVISKNITFVIDIALKPVKSISRTIVFNVTSQAKIVYGYIYFISREAIVQIKAYRVVYFIFTHHIRAQFNKITQVIQTGYGSSNLIPSSFNMIKSSIQNGYATANSGIRSVFRQFSKINSNLEE